MKITIPILVCRFSVIPIRISNGFLVEIYILILKFIWICKALRIVKTILQKKNKTLTFLDLKAAIKLQ